MILLQTFVPPSTAKLLNKICLQMCCIVLFAALLVVLQLPIAFALQFVSEKLMSPNTTPSKIISTLMFKGTLATYKTDLQDLLIKYFLKFLPQTDSLMSSMYAPLSHYFSAFYI